MIEAKIESIISGIGWVNELIEIAGGEDCFADTAKHQGENGRMVVSSLTQ